MITKTETQLVSCKYKGKYQNFLIEYSTEEKELGYLAMHLGSPHAKYNKVIVQKVLTEAGEELPLESLNNNFMDVIVTSIHRKRNEQTK